MLFGLSFKDMNSGLKLYKADVAKELQLYGGMHRFIPLIASELGFRVAEVPVRHHEQEVRRVEVSLDENPDRNSRSADAVLPDQVHEQAAAFLRQDRIGAVRSSGFAVLVYLTVLWTQGIRSAPDRC